MRMQAHDICISGGGPAGLAVALALAAKGRAVTVLAQGLPCVVPEVASASGGPHLATHSPPLARDTRTTAILGDGITLLQNLGVWDRLAAVCAPLTAIRIIDARGDWLTAPEVLFQAQELQRAAFGYAPFGYNVPNEPLRAALLAVAAAHPAITLVPTRGVSAMLPGAGHVVIETSENTAFEARLLIAADGRGSIAPKAAGITMRSWSYGQVAIATSFGHGRPHGGASNELHRRTGPLTTVPLPDTPEGPRSSLVWVETPDAAARLMALDDTDFLVALRGALGGLLGPLHSVDRRGSFPIRGSMATSVAKNRIVLAGEAAHVVPPIGAQGLNLGFRDAAAIADAVADTHGGDPGAAAVMAAYARARAADLVSREIGIDLLNRSLLLDFLPVQAVRGLGLHALANSSTLRRAAMRIGLRGPGEVPSLMRALAKAV